jgi:tungstate transport system ATP-binding protein
MKATATTRSLPIKATGLSVSFDGREIINIPSLDVVPNEVLAVMGPNGSGKTTLLLTLSLLLKPTSGTIYYDEKPVTNGQETLRNRRRIAVLFQEALLLNMSVRDNVVLGLHLRGIRGEEAEVRARRWLERFGIAHLARRQTRNLSGGEAKRASLARAFALDPEVLFLDEPFSALDAPTRQTLLGDFQSVLHETGVTTFMVTHDRNEALALADRIAVLINGQIRTIGTPPEVFSCTEDDEIARFIDAGNVLHGRVILQDRGLVAIKVGNLDVEAASDLPAGTEVSFCLGYEDVTLLPPADQTVSSARNRFVGKISRMLPAGSLVRVTVDCGLPITSVITRRSWEEMGLDLGQTIIVSFKATAIHPIPIRKTTETGRAIEQYPLP